MALKNYNPTTPSRRALVLVDKSEIYKGKPLKKLTKGLSKSGGRNNRGRITVWWRGGGQRAHTNSELDGESRRETRQLEKTIVIDIF